MKRFDYAFLAFVVLLLSAILVAFAIIEKGRSDTAELSQEATFIVLK